MNATLNITLLYFKLIRVRQWTKNLFLFIPLFFAGELMNWEKYPDLILGYFTFCFLASSIYVINDLKDVEYDKKHPKKQSRPLASGSISIFQAKLIITILIVVVIILSFFLSIKFRLFLLGYFVLNIFYTFFGKNVSILDVILISIGFLIRIKVGGIIATIALSKWIIVMVFLLALFLAFAKRRDDLVVKVETGIDMRKASMNYTIEFLNIVLALICGVIIVAYLMYCFSPEVIQRVGTYRIYYTVLFVIAGLLRYLQITIVNQDSGSPSQVLLKDRFIQVVIGGWILAFYLLVYYDELLIKFGSFWS